MRLRFLLFLWLFSCLPFAARPQSRSERIRETIRGAARSRRATVGVAVLLPGMAEPAVAGGDVRYPMMSVFKLHVAVAALLELERRGVSPEDSLLVRSGQLAPDTYSPLRERYPEQDFRIAWDELLHYCISLSDNNACDLLIDLAGGPAAVEGRIRQLGISDFAITQSERTMHEWLENCYANHTSPASVVLLLERICDGGVLADRSREALVRALVATTTGPDKLRAGIPSDVVLGHKTGSSDRLPGGVKIGDNDAGFFYLPDGGRCYVAVFIRDSRRSDAANARMTARIARRVYALAAGGY